jgi:hypothetical protein
VGVPARAVPSLRRAATPAYASGAALLAAWELAGWDVERLAEDGALRDAAARAAREAARAVRDDAPGAVAAILAGAPAQATSAALRALPHLLGAEARAMWRHHGPKIAGQTRHTLDEVIARSERRGLDAGAVR